MIVSGLIVVETVNRGTTLAVIVAMTDGIMALEKLEGGVVEAQTFIGTEIVIARSTGGEGVEISIEGDVDVFNGFRTIGISEGVTGTRVRQQIWLSMLACRPDERVCPPRNIPATKHVLYQ